MRWLCLGLLLLSCSKNGTRGACAEGGALELEQCPEAERTPADACWKMVDCGAIPLAADDPANRQYDWNDCLNDIENTTPDRQRLVIDCIAAATCDSLKLGVSNAPPGPCILLGAEP